MKTCGDTPANQLPPPPLNESTLRTRGGSDYTLLEYLRFATFQRLRLII